jgi:hypothetical protein
MSELLPDAIVPDGPDRGLVRVKRTMQVAVPRADDDDAASSGVRTPDSGVALDRAHSLGAADPLFGDRTARALEEAAAEAPSPALSEASLPPSDTAEEDAGEDALSDDAHLTVPHPHLFAIGDAADAFGALKAGHTAYWQAEIAARNIVRLVRAGELHAQRARAETQDKEREECACAEEAREMERLERYVPGEPAIKVSLGLVSGAFWGDVLCCVEGTDTAFRRTSPRIR